MKYTIAVLLAVAAAVAGYFGLRRLTHKDLSRQRASSRSDRGPRYLLARRSVAILPRIFRVASGALLAVELDVRLCKCDVLSIFCWRSL